MSTPAQIAANINNAKSSTGPRTEAGKATSSKNAVTQGLFAANDFVRPADQAAWTELNAELTKDLAPVGILEATLVDEIRRAMWRLRRCGEVESNLAVLLNDDPMESSDPAAEKAQRSVDRARSQAHRLLHKCTAELRKLQTNRQYAKELFFKDADTSDIGIADWAAITKAHAERTRAELRQKKLDHLDTTLAMIQRAAREVSSAAPILPVTKQTQPEARMAA